MNKKILLTSLSGQLGGLELRLRDETLLLIKSGYQATLALNHFPGIQAWVEEIQKEGVPFNFFEPPSFFEEWQWHRINKIRAELFHISFIKKSKADLIHVAFAWTETGGTRLWLAHKAKIPTVISVHNAFPFHKFSPWHEKLLYQSFQSVRGIYAVSDSALEHFLKTYNKFILPGTITEVIYNPVDTSIYKPSSRYKKKSREIFNIPMHDFVIGVVGRLSDQKRPLLLLEVYSELKKQLPQLRLVFIGQGELEQQCKQFVKKSKLTDSVHFLGFQKNIEQILPMLDLHVLLSKREGFGIVTAEAMACGVPVVTTDVPGSKDILNKSRSGILVPANNTNKIVKKISTLITNKVELKNMSHFGPIEVKERFSYTLINKKLKQFYNRVIF